MKKANQKFIVTAFLFVAFAFLTFSLAKAQQDLNSALKLSVSERYEDANEVYKSLIKSQPNNGDVYFYYGENILKSYQADQFSATLTDVCSNAKEIFQQGLKADSTNKLNSIGLGMVVLLQTGDTIAADRYFSKADVFPKNKKKYTDRHISYLIKLGTAQLYAKNPRYKKAIAYLEKAKEAQPNNPHINDALGDVYMDQNDASNAISNYNRALFLDPSNPVYQVKIGNIYMGARNLPAARNLFEEAQKIDSTYAPVYKGLGTMYNMSGFYKLSQANFKKFLDLSGNNTPAKISYANALFRSKNYAEALAVIEDILKVDASRNYLYRLAAYSAYEKKPADLPVALKYIETFFKNSPADKVILKDYTYYGNILLKLHQDTTQVDKGLQMLIKAYKMDPSNDELYSSIANTAYSLKRFRISAEVLSDKIASGKSNPNDYLTLGKVYYQMKDYVKADSIFTQLIKIDPDNIQPYVWSANAAASQDPDSKLGLAKPKYEMVVEKASSDTVKYVKELADAYYYLGSYYLGTKPVDYEKATKTYQKMLTLDPKNKQLVIRGYSGLAVVAAKKKDYPSAAKYFKILVGLEPDNADFKKALKAYEEQVKAQQEAANQ